MSAPTSWDSLRLASPLLHSFLPSPPSTYKGERRGGKGQKNKTRGQENTLRGQKKQGGKGFKKQGQRSEKPGVRKTGVQGLKKHAGVKKHGQGSKNHWAHLINKVNIYFIFSIGGLGFWNLKIYEWIGRYTNELGFRFFLEDIRMNWKIYEWIVVQICFWRGKYTNELEDIRMNWGSDFFWGNNKYLFYI